jgi:hypothetical protein
MLIDSIVNGESALGGSRILLPLLVQWGQGAEAGRRLSQRYNFPM